MLPHGMGDIECDACAEKDSQIASLKELVREGISVIQGCCFAGEMMLAKYENSKSWLKRAKEALK